MLIITLYQDMNIPIVWQWKHHFFALCFTFCGLPKDNTEKSCELENHFLDSNHASFTQQNLNASIYKMGISREPLNIFEI